MLKNKKKNISHGPPISDKVFVFVIDRVQRYTPLYLLVIFVHFLLNGISGLQLLSVATRPGRIVILADAPSVPLAVLLLLVRVTVTAKRLVSRIFAYAKAYWVRYDVSGVEKDDQAAGPTRPTPGQT